jgi:hypothetical protein
MSRKCGQSQKIYHRSFSINVVIKKGKERPRSSPFKISLFFLKLRLFGKSVS